MKRIIAIALFVTLGFASTANATSEGNEISSTGVFSEAFSNGWGYGEYIDEMTDAKRAYLAVGINSEDYAITYNCTQGDPRSTMLTIKYFTFDAKHYNGNNSVKAKLRFDKNDHLLFNNMIVTSDDYKIIYQTDQFKDVRVIASLKNLETASDKLIIQIGSNNYSIVTIKKKGDHISKFKKFCAIE